MGVKRRWLSRDIGYGAVVLAIFFGMAACTETVNPVPADGAYYPDVGVGCSATRLADEQWQVNCPDMALEDDASVMDMHIETPDPDAAFDDVGTPVQMPDAQTGPVACEPALSLRGQQSAALVHNLVLFQASGGTGAWRFELVDNQSGAILNSLTGAYLAGNIEGSVDRIRLTDDGCEGFVEREIRVVHAMVVEPTNPQVQPGDMIAFDVADGSGSFELELRRDRSGAQIDAENLTYIAGQEFATDGLIMRDIQSGEEVIINVTVQPSVELRAQPPVLYVPIGARSRFDVSGGSGVFDFEVAEGVTTQSGFLVAEEAGTYPITIRDRYADRTTEAVLSVVQSLEGDLPPFNDFHESPLFVATGDLNGDGMTEIVMGHSQSDAGGFNGGAVFLFESEDGGYRPEPVASFVGTGWDDQVGRSLLLADMNDDGIDDLLFGGRYLDLGSANTGGVYIHYGDGNGFSPQPDRVFPGPQNDAQAGDSIGVCDVNGDGRDDLIIGAIGHENRENQPNRWNQGALLVYLRYEDGFLNEPDQIVHGRLPDEAGVWQPIQSLLMGWNMATGDFDGDGRCDVAVTSLSWVTQNSGTVFVYRGMPPVDINPGGLSELPATWYQPRGENVANYRLGRRLLAADFNGDGLSDLVMSARGADTEEFSDIGKAYVFHGASFPEVLSPTPTDPELADVILVGARPWDNFPTALTVWDSDEMGASLGASAVYADGPNGWDEGQIMVYDLRPGAAEAAAEDPDIQWPRVIARGTESRFQLGFGLANLGDLNDDGVDDFVTTSNGRGTEFEHVGRPYLVRSNPVPEVVEGEPPAEEPWVPYGFHPLTLPWVAAGTEFGSSVALTGDINGDGFTDAIVTAPRATHPAPVIFGGAAFFYAGTADGIPTQGEVIPAFPGHSNWDLLRSAAGIGDFNGDGHDDFALLLGNDERANPLPEGFHYPVDCMPVRNDGGGLYIFLGGPEEFDLIPDYVYWGSGVGDVPDRLIGRYDFNGDGLSDIAMGSHRNDTDGLNDRGNVVVLAGMPDPMPGLISVFCDSLVEVVGDQARDHLGIAIAFMNDLDGDGCDELAIGARLEKRAGLTNQGGARVIFGHGSDQCGHHGRQLNITAGSAWVQLGNAVAAGDLDGDGLDELAIGAPYQWLEDANRGAVWVVPGTLLAQSPTTQLGELENVEPLVLADREDVRMIGGIGAAAESGRGIALANGHVIIGAVSDTIGEDTGLGTLRIYGMAEDGTIERDVKAIFVGETFRPGSRLGEVMDLSPDGRQLMIGGRMGSGNGQHNGSAYILDLDLLQ